MTKKHSSSFKSKLATGVIFVLVVIYTLYHISGLFFSENFNTIKAGITTQSRTVDGKGYVFRDEVLLRSENTGAVDYLAGHGEKVSKGQRLADVYSSGGQAARQTLAILDRQIDLLKKSSSGSELNDLAALRSTANETYYTLMRTLSSETPGGIEPQVEKMMIDLNRISSVINENSGAAVTLSELEARRADIFSGECVTEFSEESGYFYEKADGYEQNFGFSVPDGLSETGFYELFDSLENGRGKARIGDDVYGKLSKNSRWRLVLPVGEKESEELTEEESYKLTFMSANSVSVSMKLEKKISAQQHGAVLCVFYGNELPDGFELERTQDVELTLFSASGIYVPRTAVRRIGETRGVYVMRGSVMHFRRINVIYETFDYCLVAPYEGQQEGYYSLDKNDLIILNGKNLFDGRVLD